MTVKVVTDSTADIPVQLAKELDITIVPLYVRFGDKVYQDGVDITHDEFYRKLSTSQVHPSTSQPAPSDFANVYTRLAKETAEVVSIHLSRKTSGTCDSAMRGKEMAPASCHIELVDSESVSIGLGLIAIVTARVAKAGESLQTVLHEAKQAVQHTRIFGLLDTLKYLYLGGRIGKAKALVGSLLNVKPLLAMREGEIVPAGLARTRNKGLDRLFDFVRDTLNVEELGLVYSTGADEARSFTERLGAFLGAERVHLSRLGPALGVHGGPGTLLLALREKVSSVRQMADASESTLPGLKST